MVPSPPPLPASRSIPASMARVRRRVAMAAADSVCLLLAVARRRLSLVSVDAFICLYLASIWLLAAGVAAMDVGRVAYGDDCPVVVAGYMVLALSAFCLAIFSAPAVLLFLTRVVAADSNADPEKVPAGGNVTAAVGEVLCYNVMLGTLASIPFLVLMVIGGLLKGDLPLEAGQKLSSASLISIVGTLGKDTLYCFIILPTFALRVWKVTRPGWGCGVAVEGKPSRGESAVSVKIGKELQVLNLC